MKGYIVRRDSDGSGYWLRCPLCGRRALPPRFFTGVAAEQFAHKAGREHLRSVEHVAAVEAYKTTPEPSSEEKLLERIFGKLDESDEARDERLRRSAAKSAAIKSRRTPKP